MEIVKEKTKKCNRLSGAEWLRNSVSIWSNLRKTKEEISLNHPASFPLALVKKLLDCFTNEDSEVILDPFVGSGSTIIQSVLEGKKAIGIDTSQSYLDLTNTRLRQLDLFSNYLSGSYTLINDSSINASNYISGDSVDIIITSPPYWNILNRKRTADGKQIRNYGNESNDLGQIDKYEDFISSIGAVFRELSMILKVNKYCIINVMDIRKGSNFYCVHSDIASELSNSGYELDDIIIWDRSHEYNNLRPLGYPSVFRINRIHEFILVFKNRRE